MCIYKNLFQLTIIIFEKKFFSLDFSNYYIKIMLAIKNKNNLIKQSKNLSITYPFGKCKVGQIYFH